MMKIKEMLEDYIPFDDQEVKDKEYFLKCIDTFDDVLTRNNVFAHFTSSAFIVNQERTKMLVVYHNIYDGWIYPGGHADGEDDLLAVAIREVLEETGLNVKLLDDSIFSIQVCPTIGHYKKNEYVSAHIHLDVVFVLEADDQALLVYREEESNGIKWVLLDDAYDNTMVDFIRPVHKKLVKKLRINHL